MIRGSEDSQIKNKKSWLYLTLEPETNQIKWILENEIKKGEFNHAKWYLVPVDPKSNFNYFFIELAGNNETEQRSRLISKKSDTGSTKSELLIASFGASGYDTEIRNTWTLNKK